MTQLLVYLTVAVAAAVVVVLVVYLVAVIAALWSAKRSLAKLAGGLVAIRDNTGPLPDHLAQINGGLGELKQRLLAVNSNLDAIVRVAQTGKSS